MQRDVTQRRGYGQDDDQIGWAGVKGINRENKNWSTASLLSTTGGMEISEPDFAAARIGHNVLDPVAQGSIQFSQLVSKSFPRFFILAQLRVSEIRSFKEQLPSLVFDGLIKHFLEGRIGLLRHLRKAMVCGRADPDSGGHTNTYTIMYPLLSTP